MLRCFRFFALLLAAVLAAGAGQAHPTLPADSALSCGATTGYQAPQQEVVSLVAFSLHAPGSIVRYPAPFGVSDARGQAFAGTAPALTFALGAPYPNPFTDTATLTYTLDRPSPVRLELFDALGHRVAVIEDEARPAGEYRVRFNGSALTPGLYIVRLTAGDQVATRRLVRSN